MKLAHSILAMIESINPLMNGSEFGKNVDYNHTNYNVLEHYSKGENKELLTRFDNFFRMKEARIKEQLNIKIVEEQKELFYLFAATFFWKRGEQVGGEGFLAGGFAFTDIDQILFYPERFWEDSIQQFQKYEQIASSDLSFIKNLIYFESTVFPDKGIYRPMFGCLTLTPQKVFDDIYFYSNGLYYQLPFESPSDYIDALIASCGVEYWQYFYIDPTIIIAKNKGLTYITHDTHRNSSLDERLTDLIYHPNTPYDRLDLIHEHLERCVRLLPNTFPFADFTHHQNYYKKFKELYDASKKE